METKTNMHGRLCIHIYVAVAYNWLVYFFHLSESDERIANDDDV